MNTTMSRSSFCLRTLALGALLLAVAASAPGATGLALDEHAPSAQDSPAADEARRAEEAEERVIEDQPLAAYRLELLEIAYGAASAFPLDPHVKNRSRAQERVVEACFRLDQPNRALRYATQIANWRRGVAFADYADYCARHGALHDVRRYLDLAREVADGDDEELSQEWRRDRIRARVARTLYRIGESGQAAELATELSAAERGIVEAAEAAHAVQQDEDFDAQLEAFATSFAGFSNTDLDSVRAVLKGLAETYDRVYADAPRRVRLEERMKTIRWDTVPFAVQIECQMELAGVALEHGDQARALELVGAAQDAQRSTHWVPEEGIALAARLARLRHEAGDTVRAKRDLDAALARFDAERESITSMFRADALRPVAEAYRAMGDREQALIVYRNALEEGAVNKNARPRADDLADTCISLALSDTEPDEGMWTAIRKTRAGLVDPW